MSVEIFRIPYYTCGCGYKTSDRGNAAKHKKTMCGRDMLSETKNFVLEADHLKMVAESKSTSASGENNIIIGDHNSNISIANTNVTLVLPERTTREDFV